MNREQDTSKTLPWKDVIVRCFSKSFACDYDSSTLAFLHGNIDKEIELISSNNDKSSTISRTQALFEELITLYQHLRLKICQQTVYPNATLSCVRLLSQIIQLALILTQGRVQSKWIDRTLTAVKLFTGKQHMIYDALLLVNGLKKRYHKPYSVILKSVLVDSQIEHEATYPLIYMEIILLFRRLHCLALKKYKNQHTAVVKRIKPPSNLISWLTSLNVNGTSQHFKVTKYKTLAHHFMECLPEELIKKIRYIALRPYFFDNENIHCHPEAGEVPIEENLFVVDSSAVSAANNISSKGKRKKSKTKKEVFKIPEIFHDSQWDELESGCASDISDTIYDKINVPTKKLKKDHKLLSTSNISQKSRARKNYTSTEAVTKNKCRISKKKLKSNNKRKHDKIISDGSTATTSKRTDTCFVPEKELKQLNQKEQRQESLQSTEDTNLSSEVILSSKNNPKTKQVNEVCSLITAGKTEYLKRLSLKKKDVSLEPSPTKRSRTSDNFESAVERNSEICVIENAEQSKKICSDESESRVLECSPSEDIANIDNEILRKMSKQEQGVKDNSSVLIKDISNLHSKSFKTASEQNVPMLSPEKYQLTIESANSSTNETRSSTSAAKSDLFFLDYSGCQITDEKAPNHDGALTLLRSENNDLKKVNRLNEISCQKTIDKNVQSESVSSETFDSVVASTKELSVCAANTIVSSPSKQVVLSNNLNSNLVESGSKIPEIFVQNEILNSTENNSQEIEKKIEKHIEIEYDLDSMSHKKSDEIESELIDDASKDRTGASLNLSEDPNDIKSTSGYKNHENEKSKTNNDLLTQEENQSTNICDFNAGNDAKNSNTVLSENYVSKMEAPYSVVENTASQIAPEKENADKNTSNMKSTLMEKKAGELELFENQSNKGSAESEIKENQNKIEQEESISQSFNVNVALMDASVEAKICGCDGEISVHENKDSHSNNQNNNTSEIQLFTKSQNKETFLVDGKITSPDLDICGSNSDFSSLECNKSSIGNQMSCSGLKKEKQMEIALENETKTSNSDACDSNTNEVSHIVIEISISGEHSNNKTTQLDKQLHVGVNTNTENKIQGNEDMLRISEKNNSLALKLDSDKEKEPVRNMAGTLASCDTTENDKLGNAIINDIPENSSKNVIENSDEQIEVHKDNEIDASKENISMKSIPESSEKRKYITDDTQLGENLDVEVDTNAENKIQENEEMLIISEKTDCPIKPVTDIGKEPVKNMTETTNATINSEMEVFKTGEQIQVPEEKDGDAKKLEICIENKCAGNTNRDSISNTIYIQKDSHATTVEKKINNIDDRKYEKDLEEISEEKIMVNINETSHENQDVILKVNEEIIANENGNQTNEEHIEISEKNNATKSSKTCNENFVTNVIETSDTNQDLLNSSLMEISEKSSSDTDKGVINTNESSGEIDLIGDNSKLGEISSPTISSSENKTSDYENSENASVSHSSTTDVQSQSEVVQSEHSCNNPKPLLGATISEIVFCSNNHIESIKKNEFDAPEDNEIFKKLKHIENADTNVVKLASNFSGSEYISSFCADKNFMSFSDISERDKDRRIDVDSGLKSPITCFSSAASTEIFSMHRKHILHDVDETDAGSVSRDEVLSNGQEQSDETKSQAFSSDQSEPGYDSKHNSDDDEEEDGKCETKALQEIVHEPSGPDKSFGAVENDENPSENNEINVINPENIANDMGQIANEEDTLGDGNTKMTEKAALPRKSLRLIDKTDVKTKNTFEEKTATNFEKETAKNVLPNTTVTENQCNQYPIESTNDSLKTTSVSFVSVPDPHRTPTKENSRPKSKRVSALKSKQKENLEKASSASKGYSLRHSKSSRKKDESLNLDIDLNKLYLNSPSSSRSTRSSTRRESKFVKLLTSAIDCENSGDVTLAAKQESDSSIGKSEKEALSTSYNLRNRKSIITPAKLKL